MGLVVNQVVSGYRGLAVIKDITFEIKEGQIVGLVGLNGAGKSTLLKTLLGLLPLMAGDISLNGQAVNRNQSAYAKQIAYIPETPILYEELTLKEHIEMTALGYDLPIQQVMEKAQPLLKIFRLDQHLNWFPSCFSKGMKQKVMIICALITEAQLLIIDEPFLGLDPLAIDQFSKLLRQEAQRGKMVLLTTHILSIAQDLCDQYLLLQKGSLINKGNLNQLREKYQTPEATLNEIYLKMTEMGDDND